MNDTDKLVAAILAGARCVALGGDHQPEAYIAEYQKFLRFLEGIDEAANKARQEENIGAWQKQGDS